MREREASRCLELDEELAVSVEFIILIFPSLDIKLRSSSAFKFEPITLRLLSPLRVIFLASILEETVLVPYEFALDLSYEADAILALRLVSFLNSSKDLGFI